METPGSPPDDRQSNQPDPGGPQSPVPGGPQSPAPGPQSPPPAAPAPPVAAPEGPPGYGGPQPPGGWQTPVSQQAPGWAGAPLAGWGSRLAAYVIDALVLLIPMLILFFVLVAGAVGVSGDDEDVTVGAVIGALLLWLLIVAAIYLLYAPLLMARDGQRNGQTWGKQLLNIRVVRDNGEPSNFGSAALREVVVKFLAVNVASSIIPLIPWLLNFFWPLWDDENRALHDMAVSTHVVRA